MTYQHFTYVLYSKSLSQFYKGSTANVSQRVSRHNAGAEKATSGGTPWILVWSTKKASKSEAIRLEFKLKNLSQRRLIALMLKYEDDIAGPDELLLLKQLSGY